MTVNHLERRAALAQRSRQQGMSIWLLLLVGALLFIVGGAALRIMPTYLEYMAVQSAVDAAAQEGGDDRNLRKVFNRAATIENITSITGDDLIIEPVGEGKRVSFEYERRIPLAGPVNILMDYRGSAVTSK
jgi:hypothetical protein